MLGVCVYVLWSVLVAVGWTEVSPVMGSGGQWDCNESQVVIQEAKARCRMFGRM